MGSNERGRGRGQSSLTEQIVRLVAQGVSHRAIAKELGIARGTVSGAMARARARGSQTSSETSEEITTDATGAVTVRTCGVRVRTVDEARVHGGVAGDGWTVVRASVKRWEMGSKGTDGEPVVTPLWGVTVTVRPVGDGVLQLERIAARTLEQMASHAPVYDVGRLPAEERPTGRMLELDLLDPHVGMYAWAGETGQSWDLDIASGLYADVLERLLSATARYPVEQVVLPVGNDFFHCDTEARTTTSEKVTVDVDTRATKVFEVGKLVLVRAIDRLLMVAPKVRVPVVPGNHDTLSMIHLGHVLAAWYRNLGARVEIDFSPPSRKYVRYGKNLIGYEHGADVKRERLPMIMAFERPADWAATTWRRWVTGHLHHEKRLLVVASDDGCVELRQCRALCPADAWHAKKGFVGVPAGASATVWDVAGGPVAEFSVRA